MKHLHRRFAISSSTCAASSLRPVWPASMPVTEPWHGLSGFEARKALASTWERGLCLSSHDRLLGLRTPATLDLALPRSVPAGSEQGLTWSTLPVFFFRRRRPRKLRRRLESTREGCRTTRDDFFVSADSNSSDRAAGASHCGGGPAWAPRDASRTGCRTILGCVGRFRRAWRR